MTKKSTTGTFARPGSDFARPNLTILKTKTSRALSLLGLILAAYISLCTLANPKIVHAANLGNFSPGDIISDAVMSNSASMSESEIQTFLSSKSSCNNCLSRKTFDGVSAARIIYQAAQDYRINPRVLIVMLQKEQGLVTATNPSDSKYRLAMGYGCPDTAACDAKYYGFKNQVRNAANLLRNVLDGGWSNYPAYTTQYVRYSPNSSCGGSNIYIANRATSALYRYTPYQPNAAALNAGYGTGDACSAYGNRNFYLYYTDWFGDTHNTKVVLSNMYIPSGDYYIMSATGKYLDVNGASSASGANVQTWDRNFGIAQRFHISRRSDGTYQITNVASGKALDVNGASSSSGANVQIWDSNDSCAQKWAITETAGGNSYTFRNLCGGKALDVNGGSNAAGTNVQVWDYNDSAAQQWILFNDSSVPLNDGTYSLLSYKGKALDVSGGSTSSGANVQIWDNHDGNSEEFTFKRRIDGFYRIVNTRSGKALDVNGASSSSGANVQIWDINETCAQKWAMLRNGQGHYIIRNACSGKALDVNGAATANAGTNVQVWDRNASEAQKWQVASPKQSSLTSGNYQILTTSGKALSTPSIFTGSNAVITNRYNLATQKYRFLRTQDGYFKIQNLLSGKYLDVSGASSDSGANVQVWTGNNTCAQKWFITIYFSRTYINNACGGKALDVSGGSVNIAGANVQVWEHNTTVAQFWRITKL